MAGNVKTGGKKEQECQSVMKFGHCIVNGDWLSLEKDFGSFENCFHHEFDKTLINFGYKCMLMYIMIMIGDNCFDFLKIVEDCLIKAVKYFFQQFSRHGR